MDSTPRLGLHFESARVQHCQLSLPAFATCFVGREAELARLVAMLAPGAQPRLLWLCGPAGAGTSRLLIEAAQQVAPLYAHAPAYIDLAPAPSLITPERALAAAAGVNGNGSRDPLSAAVRALGQEPRLLVLDNATHVAPAVAAYMRELARRFPNLTIACASRRRLHLPGAQFMAIGPLPVPNAPEERMLAEPEALLEVPSVRLLCNLIKDVQPGFAISDANAHEIIRLCRRYDGLPLGLEIAARHLELLTSAEMDAHLPSAEGYSAEVHDAGRRPREGAAHPHALHAAYADSCALLSAEARVLLRRLAPFAGGGALDTIAEVVCFPAREATLVREHLPALLRELIEHSLVQAETASPGMTSSGMAHSGVGSAGQGGEASRFALLNTVRDFAAELLQAAGEFDAVHARAAACFSAFLAEAAPHMRTAESLAWIKQIDAEYANIRLVLGRQLARDPLHASALLLLLAWYWMWRRKFDEAEVWSRRVLDACDAPLAQARAWYTIGLLQTWRHEFGAAVDSLHKALAAADTGDDPVLRARIRHYITLPLVYSGRLAEVEVILDLLSRDPCHPVDAWEEAGHLCVRGLLARARGHSAAAMALLHKGAERYRTLGEPFGLASSLVELGKQHYLGGDYAAAEAAYLEVHRVSEQIGGRPLQSRIYFRIAEVVQAQGRLAEALDWIEAGLVYLHGQGEPPGSAEACALAGLAVDAGLWAAGVRLYAAAQAASQGFQALRAPERELAEKNLARATLALSGAEWAAAHDAGCRTRLGSALNEGLATLRRALTTPAPDVHPLLELRMLGMSEVRVGGRVLTMDDWKYARARDLLFYLVTMGDRTREQIVLDFWPDARDAEAGRNCMNVAIHFLRRALGNAAWVRYENGRYGFRPAADYRCDCDDFFSLLVRAEQVEARDPVQAEALLCRAVLIARGEFLADVTEGEWHDEIRSKVRQRRLEAWLRLGGLRRRLGRHAEAVAAYAQALLIDPFEEEIYRGLLRTHADRRDLLQIKQVYRHMCEFFEEEFGAPPSPSLEHLYRDLVAGLHSAA